MRSVLVGVAHTVDREKVIGALDSFVSDNFVILLRRPSLAFRGLYYLDEDESNIAKIVGAGAPVIEASQVEAFFKFNSGQKTFVPLGISTFTATVVAVTLREVPRKRRPAAHVI